MCDDTRYSTPYRRAHVVRLGRENVVRQLHEPYCDDALAGDLFECGTFVHRDMIGFVALDLILWLILGRVNLVPLKLDFGCNHLADRSAHVTSLRIPTDVIADLEVFYWHRLECSEA